MCSALSADAHARGLHSLGGRAPAPLAIGSAAQQAYLKASNTDADDRFGTSLAISGDAIVVGALAEDSGATGVDADQGDGGAACGRGNESDVGSMSDCLNSVSLGGVGAVLLASGTPSVGATFGDGLGCCGGGLVRLALANPPPGPEPVSISKTLDATSGIAPGDSRCYQYWYRDPGGPCGTSFNLSSAVRVEWGA